MSQRSNAGTTGPPVRGKTAKISVVRAHIGLNNEKYEWNKLVVSFCSYEQSGGLWGNHISLLKNPVSHTGTWMGYLMGHLLGGELLPGSNNSRGPRSCGNSWRKITAN
jgi:hypothetical protein